MRIVRNRILLSILLPVLGIGLIISAASIYFLTPPLFSFIKERIDSELKLASNLGLQVCDYNFNYLMELRLEDDAEMNKALRNDSIEQIKAISRQLHKVHMVVVKANQEVVDASLDRGGKPSQPPHLRELSNEITQSVFWDEPVRMHFRYFPFWDWHVVSFVFQKDYEAAIQLGRRIVYLGTFGVLLCVCIALWVVFSFFVNTPLKRILRATKGVAQGRLKKVDLKREDEIGQVIGAFNTMVEGLEKKDKEVNALIEALRESENRYRTLFEGAVEGILLADIATGRLRYVNPAMCNMLGYSEDELTRMTISDIHPPDAVGHVLTEFEAMAKGEKSLAPDIPFSRKEGEVLFADVKGTKIRLGYSDCYLTFYTDISQRKRALEEKQALEAQLQRAEKMEAIGTLAGGVAHDLNNVLSGLVSYPDLILMDLPQGSHLREPVMTIQESGKKAAAIVQDLLTLARRGVAVSEVVNLNDVIGDYLASLEYKKLKTFYPKARIETALQKDLLSIMGSPVHLSKTVMNLVSNAVESLRDDGLVNITTRNQYIDKPIKGYDRVREGDYVVLTVCDNGTGISRQDLSKIFEPFYTKKVMGKSGTGLGMAVVWGTVKDHNGYIDVESSKGKGTVFRLYFPVTREKSKQAASVTVQSLMGSGEKVLVVDDVKEQREIALILLKKLGYLVEAVSSGEEAIEYMRAHSADLLVLDMIMDPGIDGLDTYKAIAAIHPGQKAVIASGFAETKRVKQAQELGAGRYIRKPYTLERIGAAVKAELSGR